MSTQFGEQIFEGIESYCMKTVRNAHTEVLRCERACAPNSIALAGGLTEIVSDSKLSPRYRYRIAVQALAMMEANLGNADARLIPSLSVVAYNCHDVTKREASFKRLVDLLEKHDPDPVCLTSALANIGRIYQERQCFAEAEAVYRRAIALTPDNDELMARVAECLYRLGRFEEACELMKEFPRRYIDMCEDQYDAAPNCHSERYVTRR